MEMIRDLTPSESPHPRGVILKNKPLFEKDVELQDYVIIGKNGSQKAKRRTYIGENTKILTGATIYNGCDIGKNCLISDQAIIGENTIIGEGSIIQPGAFIEYGCNIGKHSRIGTNAVLRTGTNIGDNSIFGSLSASEGKNWFGNHVLIHSQCHLTLGMIVEDWVFMGPMCTSANDHKILHGRREIEPFIPEAPHIKFGSRIGSRTMLNPRVVVGRECLIGSCSLVTKNIPDFSVAYGIPAKVVRPIKEEMRFPEKWYSEFRKRVSEKDLENTMKDLLSDYLPLKDQARGETK